MRLERLSLTAIGPYANTQDIDFTKLNGLFLFEGPTGAGKSTVLDAITFALYGAPASGDSGRLASHFKAEGDRPRVEVVFRANGDRYRVSRTPAYRRPSKKGTGTVEEKHSVSLSRWDGQSWAPMSSNIAEVAEIVGQALGLTQKQFTQVVLLPQGEFDRFLDAGPDERQKVLTRLFNAERFDQITDWFERKAKGARDVIAGLKGEIREELTAAGEAGNVGQEQLSEWMGLDDPLLALNEFSQHLSHQSQVADQGVQVQQDVVEAAEKNNREAAARLETIHRLRVLFDRRSEHRRQDAEVVQVRAELRRATEARQVQALLKISDDADATAQQAQLVLAAARADCPDLGGLVPVAAARQWRSEASSLAHFIDLEKSLPGLLEASATAKEKAEHLSLELLAMRERAAEIPLRRAAIDQNLVEFNSELDALATVEADLTQARHRLSAANQVAELVPQAAAAERDLGAAVDVHQQAVDRHQLLMEQRIAGMTAELAGQLVSGEPCGVCGSMVHPSPAKSAEPVTAADVEVARLDRIHAEEQRESARTRVTELANDLSVARVAADGFSVQAAQDDLDRLLSLAARCDQLRGQRTEAKGELDELLIEQASISEQVNDLVQRATSAQGESDRQMTEVSRAQTQLVDAAAGFVSVATRVNSLETAAARAEALDEALRTVEVSTAAFDEARTRAEKACAELSLGTVDAARKAVRTAEHISELTQRIQDHDAEGLAVATALTASEFDGIEVEERPAVEVAVARSAEDLRAARNKLQTALTTADAVRDQCGRFDRRVAKVAELFARKTKAQAESKAVMDLAEFCRGMNTGQRITLTAFYLRFWFEHVIEAANLRLNRLAAGRYSLRRTDEGVRSSDRVGLGLSVLDAHTGKARSAGTLSGGERFLTSLALALGLADVVQAEAGGAKLDTLFVDEGFGTLDDERLEEILTVLDGLKENGRVVGIVSHVAELKDRINDRIEVRRIRPDGPSHLRVVA